MCLFIPFQVSTPSEAFELLKVWYKSDLYHGKKIVWLPNKDRIEIFVKHHSISLTWISGLNPRLFIDINPDIYSLVIFNLRFYINQFPIRGG